MNEDFFHNISSTGNPIEYADTVQRYQTQLPLGISWPAVTGSLNPSDLYTDDTSLYMYYPSGLNKTALSIQQRDRYGGITFTLISGSTNLYIQASEYFADPNPAFISSPYTLSGEGGTNLISASYLSDTPENPQNYWINLPNPGTYKVVFPNPVISTAFSVTHSGSSPYVFSQMLPRKSVGSYDIDVNSIRAYHVTASFIDAVAIQVSDSIVVGPDLIGAKSIDGSKIIDGTISGVLIRDGTVTGNKVLAGTISGVHLQGSTITGDKILAGTIDASKLTVTQLDAVAANMGTLVVNSGITVGTNGYITVPSGYISAGKAKLDNTGLHIGDVASSNLPSITDTLRIAGSGNSGNIVGMALYNGAFSATNPQAVLQLDSTNALEIEMRTISGMVNINFPEQTRTGQFFQVYNADLYLRRSPDSPVDIEPGAIYGTDSDGTTRYYMGHDQLRLNNNTADTFIVDALNGNIATVGDIEVLGNIHAGAGDHVFTVNGTTGNLHVGAPPHVFTVNGSSGNTTISGNLSVGPEPHVFKVNSGTGAAIINGTLTASGDVGFGTSNNKVTIAGTTGNTLIAGTLGVTGAVTTTGSTRVEGNLLIGAAPAVAQIVSTTGDISTNGNITSLNNVYGATVTATTDLYGEDTLNVANDGAGDYRFKVSSTGKLTSDAMGYITARRTADVAITTAGTTIVWNNALRSNKITVPTNSSTITITNAGYYMFSATFATVANLTSLRMTLQRGGINYVSTLHGAGLSTGGGYLFNFNIGFFASAGSTYTVVLTPSANTTLNANGEGFAGPSPLMNIFQAIGV